MAHQSADPFHLIASELDVAVSDLQSRISAWVHLLSHSSDYETIEAEKLAIERSCQSLSSSLQKVAKSIQVSEERTDVYRLADEELASRKSWLQRARASHQKFVMDIRAPSVLELFRKRQAEALAHRTSRPAAPLPPPAPSAHDMQGGGAAAGAAADSGVVDLPHDRVVKPTAFLADQRAQQDALFAQQDQAIDELRKGTTRLQQAGRAIKLEVEDQNAMLDKLQGAAEEVQARLSAARRTVDELTKVAGKNGTIALVAILILVLLAMIALLVLL